MSFLNRSVLQERAAAATVERHPLLKECDVPPNVKQAYLQGCVLAVLERDDGKVMDSARQEITRLGLSLVLSNEDIAEAISIVSGLNSPEAQDSFLGELASVLSGDVYVRYFMKDFELLMSKNGSLSESERQTLDCIGSALTGKSDWRSAIIIVRNQSDGTSVDELINPANVQLEPPKESAVKRELTQEDRITWWKARFPQGGEILDYVACVQELREKAARGDSEASALLNCHQARLVDWMSIQERYNWYAQVLSGFCGVDFCSIDPEDDFYTLSCDIRHDLWRGLKFIRSTYGLSINAGDLQDVRSLHDLDELIKYQRSVELGVLKDVSNVGVNYITDYWSCHEPHKGIRT